MLPPSGCLWLTFHARLRYWAILYGLLIAKRGKGFACIFRVTTVCPAHPSIQASVFAWLTNTCLPKPLSGLFSLMSSEARPAIRWPHFGRAIRRGCGAEAREAAGMKSKKVGQKIRESDHSCHASFARLVQTDTLFPNRRLMPCRATMSHNRASFVAGKHDLDSTVKGLTPLIFQLRRPVRTVKFLHCF